jgi:hypothetical protein
VDLSTRSSLRREGRPDPGFIPGSLGRPTAGLRDFVLSADEKTSIQARRRIHASTPPASGRPARIEHAYERRGAWAYLAAWDVRRAKIFGRCEATTGIAPFDRLVEDVMGQEPYRSARRVFWIFDNGSSHRGQKADQRLQSRWPSIIPVHTPVHASWLNQVEIYFSIIQRKVLTPSDFSGLVDRRPGDGAARLPASLREIRCSLSLDVYTG